MAKRRFNWTVATVVVIALMVLVITAIGLRKWQRNRMAYSGKEIGLKAYANRQWETAAENLGKYLAIEQTNIDILLKYADSQLNIRPIKQNNIQQAIATYRIILRLDKKNKTAVQELASLYLQLSAEAEAELITRRYLELDKDPKIQRMFAISLAEQRKFKEAANQLEDIINKHPQQIPAYEVLGRITEYYPEEFPDRLKNWFTEAVKKNPFSAEALIARSSFYIRNGNIGKAVEDLEKAEGLDISDLAVHLRLATEFMEAKIFEKAKTHFELIHKKNPKKRNLWQQWAKLALETKEKTLMLKIANAGLEELKPDSWDFMPLAAELFIRCGDFNNAQICMDKLEQKEISSAVIMFLKGLWAETEKRDHEAIRFWQQARELGDKSEKTQLALAAALSRVGENQSAVIQLKSLVFERPYLFRGHLRLAQLLAQTGKWIEAQQEARFAMQISPNSLDAVTLYIRTQIELIKLGADAGDKKETLQNIKQQLAKLDNITDGVLKVKMLQFQIAIYQKDFEYAEKLLKNLKINESNKTRIDIAGINLLIARNKIEDAISKLHIIIEKSPENISAVKYLAALSAGNKNEEECEKVLQDAIQRIEDDFAKKDLCILMAQFYEQWGQNEKAYQILKKISQQMPDDIIIKRQLLRNKNVLKNNNYAQEIVDSIKAIEGESGWQWRNEQAKIWLKDEKSTDKYPQIITLLRKVLSINPEDQVSRMFLAITYEKFGKLQLAVATYKEALSISPDDIRIIVPTIAALYKAKEYKMADEILNRVTSQKISHPELSRLEFQSHIRHGKLSSAEKILEDLTASNPDNKDAKLSLALIKIRQKKYTQADDILRKLKDGNPDSIPITAALVNLNVNQKKHQQALLLCNQLIKKLNNSSAYILRGQTHLKLSQNNLAKSDLEQAIMIEPDNVYAWISKSQFHRILGEYDQAAECIRKALTLDPNSIQIQKRAVVLLLSSNRQEKNMEGLNLLDNALASNPHDFDFRMYKAKWLITKGNLIATTQAQRILQRIFVEQPKNPEPWILMAKIYLGQEQIGKTMDAILRGLAYFPGNENLLLLKAQAEAKRSPALAIPTLKMLRQLHPNNAKVILELAETYILTEQYDNCILILQDYLNICPQNERNRIDVALAAALYKKGDKVKANEKFDAISLSDPNNPNSLLTQIVLLQQEDQWGNIFKKAYQWHQNHPKDIKTQITIAKTLAQSKSSRAQKTAEDIYQMVLKRNPNSIDVIVALAMHLQINGRYEESCKLYEKAVRIKPDKLIALNNLAWMMSEDQGKYKQALELTQRGLKKNPDYIDLIDTRGIAYYRLGEHHNAVRDFRKCIEMYPENLPARTATHFHLARALAAIGQNREADTNIQKALDLNNKIGGLSSTDLAEAKRMLGRL